MNKHKKVLNLIADEFGVEHGFHRNKTRYKAYSLSRKMACWVLYTAGGINMQQIATIIGYSDHSTALYHIHDYWNMCKFDDDFKEKGERVYSKAIEIYDTN